MSKNRFSFLIVKTFIILCFIINIIGITNVFADDATSYSKISVNARVRRELVAIYKHIDLSTTRSISMPTCSSGGVPEILPIVSDNIINYYQGPFKAQDESYDLDVQSVGKVWLVSTKMQSGIHWYANYAVYCRYTPK
ncbi:MAG: hypothetical protein PVG30_04375 [Gammaproteobacteria bacterium]|jgi:hypothetical protein